ncbi:xanthine dehydrogenase family protein molybdopterin-binding subunit [Rhodopseudomonas sp. HC1]|uniref:xanthine dehydrogenase family protein molybdopterin-binding subunit n=1 Tax=Rhodopseudomonas infernalis TaxID=2897386 RepID=UPI001EE786B2|nr:xanthine dehydrogenase family protein molybdopterin-binding subunit [Rhodopseudomonas infernalis]MCG6205261.1 xanthine dehydrogenase family protein molybdopterin-binding subunit [Rhodopseudomonas infernalis]
MSMTKVANSYIGRPMERVEDLRMVRGRGTYVADVNRPNQLYAVVLRSSVAHGIIRSIDVSAALALDGVHRVLTANDFGAEVPVIPLRLQPLPQLEPFHQPVVASGKVRYVGEPVAVVIADSAAIAEDALERIVVDIDPLPAIANRQQAEAMDSVLFEQHQSNVAITWTAFRGDADDAFKTADYVRRDRFKIQRHAAMFMEPRGFVADWDAAAGKLTVWGAAKTAWYNRRVLAAALGLALEAVDLIEVDVGGGFGSRGEFYPEDYLIPAAAKIVGRPVKWLEDRREHMMSANHARDIECDVEFAMSKEGRFIGLRGQIWADIGAYVRTNGSVGPRNVAQYMSGPYAIEHIDLKSSMLTTNKTPSGTYRGPGRFETDFIRERMIDLAARDLNIDRVELRRRNLVADAQMPYPLASITPYDSSTELDSGDYHAVFDRCLKEFAWADKKHLSGKLIDGYYHGLAVGSFIEGGAAGPKEEVRLVLEIGGGLTAYLGSSSVGQGLETIMAQIAADATEIAYDKITVHHGSTTDVKDGYGAYHSRSTVMGGSAILLAAEKLKLLIRQTAAARFGCSPEQVTIDGETVRHEAKHLSFADLVETPLEVEAEFLNKKYTWAYGTQAAHVAVDPGTGHVKVLDYMSVEDVGRMINPLTLHGQAIGSIVQGLGGAFLEHLVYDDEGQLLTGSFADYLMPTASDFPNIRSITLELKPCPNNPLGAKGAGEGGLIPVGGIMANAVADALSHLDVQPMELPLSPPRIWQMVQDAEGRIRAKP